MEFPHVERTRKGKVLVRGHVAWWYLSLVQAELIRGHQGYDEAKNLFMCESGCLNFSVLNIAKRALQKVSASLPAVVVKKITRLLY